MIHDSRQGFELLGLNSLFPWAFPQQDEKTKMNGIINGSVTLK